MFNFKQFYTINEGAAGGHMKHPFDLPEISTGSDLVNLYKKTVNFLSGPGVTVPLKIDGVNASVRLVDVDGTKQFALYRNSIADVETPTTINNIESRFVPGHGLIEVYKTVLGIFNKGLEDTKDELQELGLFDNPLVVFNTEFVMTKTNIVNFGNNFLAIHYPAIITRKVGASGNVLKSYETRKIPFSEEVLSRFVGKLNNVAKRFRFNVVHKIPAHLIKKPDFNIELETQITLANETKSLAQWLNSLVIPKNSNVKTNDGVYIKALAQEGLYNKVIVDKIPLEKIVTSESVPTAINGIITWHTCRLLGKALLQNITSSIGKADTQEGIVIDNTNVASTQFKITGDFFVRNRLSGFRKDPSKTQQKVVVVYSGRFQPFHRGHAHVYNRIKKMFPKADVFIATSNNVAPETSPFNFNEKLQMVAASGIDPDVVRNTAQPYLAKEIFIRYEPQNTIAIFAVSQKDMQGPKPRFKFGMTNKGTPSYTQPLTDMAAAETMDKHSYVIEFPTLQFNVLGQNITSATEIRNLWKTANGEQKQQIVSDLYGQPDINIIKLFDAKLT